MTELARWRSGNAGVCKTSMQGFNSLPRLKGRLVASSATRRRGGFIGESANLTIFTLTCRAASSSVERFPDKKEAHGPTPWPPTKEYMAHPEKEARKTVIGRHLTEAIVRPLLNFEIVDEHNGMAQAKLLLDSGQGLILGFTHFSKKDGPIYGAFALQYAKDRTIPVVLPIALHQYMDHQSILERLVKMARGTIIPIVIDDTQKDPQFSDLPLNEGMDKYFLAAKEALSRGGIVALSLQGGRKPTLGEPVPALSTLVATLYRHRITKYGIQYVGIAPKRNVEPQDYLLMSGWNFFSRYQVRPGSVHTFQEVQKDLELKRVSDFRKVDDWGIAEIRTLVQPSYSKQPNLS